MSNSDSIGDAPVVVLVPLDLIDPSPAAAVRTGRREETVADYALVLTGDDHTPPAELPALDCWHYTSAGGRDVYVLGDGGHRLAAYQRAGRAVVPCSVRRCGCQQEAERLAWRHAAGANAAHGLPRSREDKRAAVKAVIVRPEYEDAPDTELATVCNVSPTLVGLVRRELSAAKVIPAASNAHASNPKRRYKENARLRPGYETDAAGKLVKVPTQNRAVPPATPAETTVQNHVVLDGKAHSANAGGGVAPCRAGAGSTPHVGQPCPAPDPAPAPADADLSPEPVSEPIVVPATPATELDHFKRPVPDGLRDVFAERTWFREFGRRMDALLDEIAERGGRAGGRALASASVHNACQAALKTVKDTVTQNAPLVVCPVCDGMGTCRGEVCRSCTPRTEAAGRGWLTRFMLKQLSPDQRAKAERAEHPASEP